MFYNIWLLIYTQKSREANENI